ncbi:hypothetical protein LIA77_09474 [Sarocladium implicatum]|nr:hypothetical protein LIA77_09474 [Sarocladium implicatum]
MDFVMQALYLPDGAFDDEHDSLHGPNRSSTSWPVGYSAITGDRRSSSEGSNQSGMPSSANSIISETVPSSSITAPLPEDSQATAKPKRRRENRYKNAPPAVISRRRAQNRNSQRAYRERKDQRIRDLEELLEEAHRKEESMSQAYHSLQIEYDRLIAERQQQQQQSDGTTGALLEDPTGGFGDASAMFGTQHGAASGAGAGAGGTVVPGYEFLETVPGSDMMTGLYLQHDGSTYPPIQ